MKRATQQEWFSYITKLGIPFFGTIGPEMDSLFYKIDLPEENIFGSFDFKRASILEINVKSTNIEIYSSKMTIM